ncbi:N,N-dimethylaniline monooxygenase [Aureococcus anophagefferens]|nr:N,N-dimethylaniline monooxygenase [Aureococcus anophagefferens]
MASYAQKGDAAAYSRDAIISNMLSEVGDALEGSLECCPALPTVLKLAHRDFAAQPGGPATGGERVAVRETAAHGLETVAAVSLRAGVAAFLERTSALRFDLFAALACDALTWFANHAYLRGSVPHARAVSAANFVWTRTTALQNGS